MDERRLDETQEQVVAHDAGPLLVLGSPGTGKTTVLVRRWIRLAQQTNEPHRILLLLPARERAIELRDELPYELPQQAVLEVPVHTWHALAYHLVTRYYRQLGYAQPPLRLTNAEQLSVVRDMLARVNKRDWDNYADHLSAEAFVAEVADFCVRAGYRGLHDDELRILAEKRPEHAPVAHFAIAYREHLRENAILDYPEMILAAARLIEEQDDLRSGIHRRFPHVLVDDAQELAPAQLKLLKLLARDHLVCAGDPDSAIEAFRGSDPHWLDRFNDIAPDHTTITLPTSHRFDETIGAVAISLISQSPDPRPHRATTFAGPQATAELKSFATMAGELESTARELRTAHLIGKIPYERMAILLAQPATYGHSLERVLDDFRVPYRIASADRPLGAEPAARAVLDVCRLAITGDTTDGLCKAVLSSPLIGLGPYKVRDLERTAYLERKDLLEVVRASTTDATAELRTLLDIANEHPDEPADETFFRVFDASTWCRSLVETRNDDPESSHHMDALSALSRALSHFVERRPKGTMRDYLGSLSAETFATDTWAPSRRNGGVQILSFHRSKGLEWDVVCALGIAEGQMPKAHRAQGLFDPWALEAGNAQDRAIAQLAEERRTFYVALTRARKRLVVSCSPGVRKSTPSRFCNEAFGTVPEAVTLDPDEAPVTLDEAAARHRRTLASEKTSDAEKYAAAAALAHIAATNGGIDTAAWWWRREWTNGNVLYPTGKLTTSYSRISKFDECPLRYVLESVLGLDPQSTYQMKFGSLVHKIIERADVQKGDLTTWEQVKDVYNEEFKKHQSDYPNRPFAVNYWHYGQESLSRWWRTERNRGETIEVEYAFNDLDFEGHIIRGRIDRVSRNGKGLVLSDYKTSRNAAQWEDAKESLQLAIYYAAAKKYPDLKQYGEPQLAQLIYPGIEHVDRQDGSEVCAKRFQYPKEADQALGRLGDILERASREEFAPSPEADCQWCRMRPLCPRWPEGKEVPK
jgi:superfamily I DNA/RNA helicase